MQVGFIGIGAMGEPMAANLLRKGFALDVLRHRRAEAPGRLEALGAKLVTSPADAARASDVVILCLPTSREVEAVIGGAHGVAAAAKRGAVVVDCSTSDPRSTRRLALELASRGIGMVDAGMTRGVAGAKQGTLAFFVGGEEGHIEQAMPVLKALGDTFVRCGQVGLGHTAKIVSNVLSYGTVALVNEALMLGTRSGVDARALFEALTQGAPSKALEAFGPRLVAGDYEPPRVSVEHVCDDLMLAQELAARAATPLCMLGAAQALYRLLDLRGEGARDMSVLAELWRSAAAPKA